MFRRRSGERYKTMNRFRNISFVVGLVGLVFCGAGLLVRPEQFFVSYLFGLLVWLAIALGSLAWLMIHFLTGGKWGYPVRRLFETAIETLPLLALLFVPIFFGLHHLYQWTNPASIAADKILQHKHSYMNEPAFIVRAVVLFAIWIWMARLLTKWSRQQDATPSPQPLMKLRKLSGPGLVIYPLTVTFAYIDWVMSLEPDWYSTLFPIIVCVGQMLAALTFAIVLFAWLAPRTSLASITDRENFHHLGNLLLAFTMMWAYLAFAQFLIIWSGDLPHEIAWYTHRIAGGWRGIVLFLVAFHFLVPFFLLLSRPIKRSFAALTSMAAIVFVAHVVEVWWMIAPSFYPKGIRVSWLDFAALVGIGATWFALFAWRLQRKPLLSLNDPRFVVATA
jgi:hypothetical protein